MRCLKKGNVYAEIGYTRFWIVLHMDGMGGRMNILTMPLASYKKPTFTSRGESVPVGIKSPSMPSLQTSVLATTLAAMAALNGCAVSSLSRPSQIVLDAYQEAPVTIVAPDKSSLEADANLVNSMYWMPDESKGLLNQLLEVEFDKEDLKRAYRWGANVSVASGESLIKEMYVNKVGLQPHALCCDIDAITASDGTIYINEESLKEDETRLTSGALVFHEVIHSLSGSENSKQEEFDGLFGQVMAYRGIREAFPEIVEKDTSEFKASMEQYDQIFFGEPSPEQYTQFVMEFAVRFANLPSYSEAHPEHHYSNKFIRDVEMFLETHPQREEIIRQAEQRAQEAQSIVLDGMG